GAVVRDVVDDGDRVGGHAWPGRAAIVGEGPARRAGNAGGGPPGDGGVVLAASDAMGRVAAGDAWRRRRAPGPGRRARGPSGRTARDTPDACRGARFAPRHTASAAYPF